MINMVTDDNDYSGIHSDIVTLLESARRAAARSVNALMTATYWEIGRRIVEFEQGGADRAGYGQVLLKRLSVDLSSRFGRGFSERNLEQMRLFYQAWPNEQISQTVSAKLPPTRILQTPSAISGDLSISETASRNSIDLARLAKTFPPALVGLRAPAVSQERERPPFLRNRGLAISGCDHCRPTLGASGIR
jgi:hypothetical protein